MLMDSVGRELDRVQCGVACLYSIMAGGWDHLEASLLHIWCLGWGALKASGISWDQWPEHLCVDSPCGLGFSQRGGWVPREVPQKKHLESQCSKRTRTFDNLVSEVTCHHFCCSGFVDAISNLHRFKGSGDRELEIFIPICQWVESQKICGCF